MERVQDAEAEISLVVGHYKLLETRRPLTRIAVANPAVADVELLNDEPNTRMLNLFGRSFGNTTITFWDFDNLPITFLVRVTLDAKDLESRIRQTFPGAMVRVRQVGSQIILEGQVPDSKTMSDVLQLVQQELRNSGGLRVQGGGTGVSTGGGVSQGSSSNSPMPGGGGGAMAGGGALNLIAPIINRVHVPGPRQVMLRVKIAELNRTTIRQLGVSWLDPKNNAILASTIGGAASIAGTAGPFAQTAATGARGALSPIASTFNSGATATNANAQLFGIFNAGQFSLFLNALRSNALAKILAEPTLMAVDGQPARFLAGGLFPYPVPQSSSIPGGTAVVTVQFANFGAILSFLPHILANDVIRLDVEPVFSQLNFGAGTTINGGRVPAIDQRSARTVVELREGQTLAIAGLLQTTTNAATSRIPFLGDLPIVGPLFSSNQIETVETELVVLVTPELVSPMESNEVPPSPGDRVNQPNDYEFYFLGRIEGKLGREFRATTAEHDPLNVMKHFESENHWVVGPHGHAD
ncbi:MAG: type II and III secretion system protein family protein [Isosphaeraceae bacterium]